MQNSNYPQVSLIIACYNQASYLEKILLTLKNQTFSNFEIVIADDGSGAELAEVIKKYQGSFTFPIQHIWHEDNGFRKTIIINEAVRNSNSEYLLFIDGDCLLHHKFIERHYTRRKRNVVLSGRRIMLDETISKKISNIEIENKTFEKPSFWWNNCIPKERKRGFYIPFIYTFINKIGKDYWAFGSNFSIHKSDFFSVNGYDQAIVGRGLEDINLSQRFKLKGYKTNRLTYEALQYHLFHNSKPVPHSKEEEAKIIYPKHFYAEKGINNV